MRLQPITEDDPVTFSWNFGDGASAAGPIASHAYSAAGTYAVTVSANDGQGAVAVASTSVTIDPASVTVGKPTKKFKLGKKGFALGALVSKPHIPLVASSATSVTLTLARSGAGWVKGKKCTSKKPAGGKKRCDIKLSKSLVLQLPAGSSRLGFGGVWNGKKLPLGKYRLTVTPAGGAPVSSVRFVLAK